MSELTLLTRKEVEERALFDAETFRERLLKTVDTAQGLLQAELKAAVTAAVAHTLNAAKERAEEAEFQLEAQINKKVAAELELETERRQHAETRDQLETSQDRIRALHEQLAEADKAWSER